jgi:hypothetical protein
MPTIIHVLLNYNVTFVCIEILFYMIKNIYNSKAQI